MVVVLMMMMMRFAPMELFPLLGLGELLSSSFPFFHFAMATYLCPFGTPFATWDFGVCHVEKAQTYWFCTYLASARM